LKSLAAEHNRGECTLARKNAGAPLPIYRMHRAQSIVPVAGAFQCQNGRPDQADVCTPAHTQKGRRAKVLVLLGCIMGATMQHVVERRRFASAWPASLLIEFIGGEPGDESDARSVASGLRLIAVRSRPPVHAVGFDPSKGNESGELELMTISVRDIEGAQWGWTWRGRLVNGDENCRWAVV